jgi:hypothetical protein
MKKEINMISDDKIVESLINLRNELYQTGRDRETFFKINSCLYKGYKLKEQQEILEMVNILTENGYSVYKKSQEILDLEKAVELLTDKGYRVTK